MVITWIATGRHSVAHGDHLLLAARMMNTSTDDIEYYYKLSKVLGLRLDKKPSIRAIS
jgi:hypothetical protein